MNETKSGFVAVIGMTNVGKSTLVNTITESKISIVSNKPQTTRNTVTGIYTDGEYQIVLIDTPGFLKIRNKLSKIMNESIENSRNDSDIVLFVTDCRAEITDEEKDAIVSLKSQNTDIILAINKTDIAEPYKIAEKISNFSKLCDFSAIVPVSAVSGYNIPELTDELKKLMKKGPFYFPDDITTSQPLRVIVSELLREKALIFLKDEIPHGIATETIKFSEREDKDIIDIEFELYCEKQSHKAIIIGKDGKMLKKILSETRKECEDLLGSKVNIKCFVKVKEDWRNNEFYLKNFGFSN